MSAGTGVRDSEFKRVGLRLGPCLPGRMMLLMPLFRPSHPDFRACQQDSTLVGDRDGSVLVATANLEVWRVGLGASEPTLVVKGELDGVTLPVDADGNSIVGIPQVHLDSKRRLWLIYRFGLDFSKHAVSVTGAGSELDKASQGWLARFPMWDWVGGRTSELSAVGLLPAALQGIDIDAMLEVARLADVATRTRDLSTNPAALMALMCHHATGGRGQKDLVVLPYKDRLLLMSRYLQQLVMESLGKEKDLAGNVVHQGLAVYGNKGSTDQHAYVQQLRDGVPSFFALFIEVLKDRSTASLEVEPRVTSGDYLLGFLLGTRAALDESGRESMTLTVPDVSPRVLGALIAVFERAVGLYGSLINVNAYHQPGVEAGKKAATAVVALQQPSLRRLTVTHRLLVSPRRAATPRAPSVSWGLREDFTRGDCLPASHLPSVRRALAPCPSARFRGLFFLSFRAAMPTTSRSAPAARTRLSRYQEVPFFMRQAMRDYGVADPSMRGLH